MTADLPEEGVALSDPDPAEAAACLGSIAPGQGEKTGAVPETSFPKPAFSFPGWIRQGP